jgi:L-rhamnose isomerase
MVRGLKNLGSYIGDDQELQGEGGKNYENAKKKLEEEENKLMQNLPQEHRIFLKKLLELNIPFNIKTILRDFCHKVLKMPLYFDFLALSSILKCY